MLIKVKTFPIPTVKGGTAAVTISATDVELEQGGLVEVRSGGPLMTVEKIHDDGDVDCVWFEKVYDQAGNQVDWSGPHRSTYVVSALQLVLSA
jgi:uncharacterized protein YodC (DUF2158 family)